MAAMSVSTPHALLRTGKVQRKASSYSSLHSREAPFSVSKRPTFASPLSSSLIPSRSSSLLRSSKFSDRHIFGRSSSNRAIVFSAAAVPGFEALVFDCDGVILESEDLHRCAYNATFQHFNVMCPGNDQNVNWSTEFYDGLQNKIGGGKPKMRWYFNEYGWPTSSISPDSPPEGKEAQEALIDALQEWKTNKYQSMIGSGEVAPRPGIIRLMDEAREQGLMIAVCSAATKSSVIFVLTSLLGKDRFEQLDCFLAGDDVDKKKPDPTIYRVAAKILGVAPHRCMVIEDSLIGLQAALGAGMRCAITYTSSTKSQGFEGASAVYPDMGQVRLKDLLDLPAPVPTSSFN
eukprot:TRINITY_DN22970_c0_g2_i1.p1 TRINITY_DN22970_c0_g2~~TRINITY_DN22970_c0_g2_i1.p1  ORF type:complete len:353 (-),score=51.95 TRINITY_DN22970_c0_g2_i1:633-1670(-)